jgi:hypothetical protein
MILFLETWRRGLNGSDFEAMDTLIRNRFFAVDDADYK